MSKILTRDVLITIQPPEGLEELGMFQLTHGGWAFVFRKTITKEQFVCTRNMVHLAPFNFAKIQNSLPVEEFWQYPEETMLRLVSSLDPVTFTYLIEVFERASKKAKSDKLSMLTEMSYDLMKSTFEPIIWNNITKTLAVKVLKLMEKADYIDLTEDVYDELKYLNRAVWEEYTDDKLIGQLSDFKLMLSRKKNFVDPNGDLEKIYQILEHELLPCRIYNG